MGPFLPSPISRSALAVVVYLAALSPCGAQAPEPVAPPSQRARPPAAYSSGAAFDAAHQRLVVFGGYAGGGYLGDTWEWNGSMWNRSSEPGPGARNGPQLAYEDARHRVVLFGGDTRTQGALGDTWERDGSHWEQVAVSGPPARSNHAMAYDARRKRAVLFGGASAGRVLGDTWEWDGATWLRAASDGPPARALHALAYDVSRGRVVLFGGTSALAPDAPTFGDTWEWDGGRWTKIDVAGPSARDHVAMAYDAAHHLIVLHGGGATNAQQIETWTFDGKEWKRVSVSGPPRANPNLVFDTESRSILLYGGFSDAPSNELWRFDMRKWGRITP